MVSEKYRSRTKVRGRRSTRPFISIPHDALEHPSFAALSAHAVKLLLDVAKQYRGANNGDLTAIFTVLQRERHWKSRETLHRALGEVLQAGFLMRTRKGKRIGGTHCPSLYAITWWAIDASDKHEYATPAPPRTWQQRNPATPGVLGSPSQVRPAVLG